jgi:hypothetical protein
MDYKKLFYQESKRKFLNDVTNTICKEAEDVDICIKKNMNAFDVVFESLNTQLNFEDKLLAEFKVREKEGVNYLKQMPFIERHRQFRFYDDKDY